MFAKFEINRVLNYFIPLICLMFTSTFNMYYCIMSIPFYTHSKYTIDLLSRVAYRNECGLINSIHIHGKFSITTYVF